MPRLDASRIAAWRRLRGVVADIERGIDEDLRAEWDITLGWFDVLATLQRMGGWARPNDIAADLRLPPSSVSRRLDRLEEEGWIARHRSADSGGDQRAVDVELTRTGRRLWREMNVSYRRSLQARFGIRASDDDIDAVVRLAAVLDDPDLDDTDDVSPSAE
jgi:DNA-binding MarR family transcriptional regulator